MAEKAQANVVNIRKEMARPRGFEPLTAWFVARYSIQLSYGRAMAEREGFEPSVPVYWYGSLAGNWFQPLTHLSERARILP